MPGKGTSVLSTISAFSLSLRMNGRHTRLSCNASHYARIRIIQCSLYLNVHGSKDKLTGCLRPDSESLGGFTPVRKDGTFGGVQLHDFDDVFSSCRGAAGERIRWLPRYNTGACLLWTISNHSRAPILGFKAIARAEGQNCCGVGRVSRCLKIAYAREGT